MICQHCQRSFRENDSVKCSCCDSKYHTKCMPGKELSGSGDKGHQWRCGQCRSLLNNSFEGDSKDLLKLVHTLSAKFEVVNFQLPKLNGELARLKFMSDYIAKQNEEILRKISEIDRHNKHRRPVKSAVCHYRKRQINLRVLANCKSNNKHKKLPNDEQVPMMMDKTVARYRKQRRTRSRLFNRMLHLLNSKLNRSATNSPRQRRRY